MSSFFCNTILYIHSVFMLFLSVSLRCLITTDDKSFFLTVKNLFSNLRKIRLIPIMHTWNNQHIIMKRHTIGVRNQGQENIWTADRYDEKMTMISRGNPLWLPAHEIQHHGNHLITGISGSDCLIFYFFTNFC